MNIQINGEERQVSPGLTVSQLLAELGMDPQRPGTAVAVDGEVIFRQDWKEKVLAPGARVEIVRAVAGG